MSLAKVTLIGNVGRAPELRQTPQGTTVCKFTVAVSRRDEEKPLWFSVTCWRRLAEVAAEYLTVGRQVYIEGRLSLDEWTDRDGKARTTLQLDAEELQFIGRAENEQAAGPRKDEAEIEPDLLPMTVPAQAPKRVPPTPNRPAGRANASTSGRPAAARR